MDVLYVDINFGKFNHPFARRFDMLHQQRVKVQWRYDNMTNSAIQSTSRISASHMMISDFAFKSLTSPTSMNSQTRLHIDVVKSHLERGAKMEAVDSVSIVR